MHFEVEQKFRVDDPAALLAKLAVRHARLDEAEVQVDRYYAHPARDFAQTDEALRIRRIGQANYVTYKGPKLDATTKTRRRRWSCRCAPSDAGAADFADLLAVLGFRPVIEVRKRRRNGQFLAGPFDRAGVDEVDEVGSFAELEILADAADVEAAEACLASLARELDLINGERPATWNFCWPRAPPGRHSFGPPGSRFYAWPVPHSACRRGRGRQRPGLLHGGWPMIPRVRLPPWEGLADRSSVGS